MVKHDINVTGRVPKLGGSDWATVAPFLEEFLKRLMGANDSAQVSLETISVGADAEDSVLARRRSYPHRHQAEEVAGLEEPIRTRRAAPHTHRPDEVVGLLGDTELVLQSRIFGS